MLAVTDHNRLDWYPILAEVGRENGVTVFPGLEFNVNKCHLLAIWDCTDDGHQLGLDFLKSLFPPGENPLSPSREPRPTEDGSPLQLARRAAQQYHALVLAPHATARDIGLFGSRVCNTSSTVAQSGCIAGFDVHGNSGADVLRNPKAEFGDMRPAWFVSGDTRSLDEVGQRATYLKINDPPTLESLRQAFLMPDRRVRFPERFRATYGDVPGLRFLETAEPTWPRIANLTIAGGFHDGLDVELGPGLNAIIGGKGTGKSAIVEIIRHATAAQDSTQGEGPANRRRNLPANAEARMSIVDLDGQTYDVMRPGDEQAPRLLRGGADTGVDVRRRFPIRVFGQRELAGLPDQPEALRGFVARAASSELDQLREDESRLAGDLQQADSEVRSLESALARITSSEERLADLRDRLQQAAEKGASDLVAASKALSIAQEQVSTAASWPSTLAQAVGDLREAAKLPTLGAHPSIPEQLGVHLQTAAQAARRAADEVEALLRQAEEAIRPHLAEHERHAASQRHDINAALADAGLADPDDLARKQRESAKLEDDLAAVPGQRQRLAELLEARDGQMEQLRYTRRAASRVLSAAAARLTAEVGGLVRVTVEPFADRSQLHKLLKHLLAGQNVRAEQLGRLADSGPPQLVEAARSGEEAVVKLGVSHSTASKITNLRPDQMRQIEECETPDLIKIEINLGEETEPRWLAIGDVSPGQRATAMLSLVLATGDEPIVIDQPEDDLDNSYIYEQVVQLLSRVSDRRQIIVATHNANIPVLGDAEFVLALTASVDHGAVLASGGLDEPSVANRARQILEGGEEAFRARARRYGTGEDR